MKSMRFFRWMFVGCMGLFVTPAHGQTLMNLDSLLRLLPAAKADSNKVDLYINIGQQYESSRLETAAHYYRLAGALSKQLQYTRGVIKYINNYTYILNLSSQYDSSLKMNLEAVQLARSIGDSLYLAKALFNAGTSAKFMDRLRTAAQYYLEGQRIFQRFGNEPIAARVHDILQLLYESMEEFDKAKMHGLKAVAMARQLNDSLLLVSALSNLGMSYSQLNQLDSSGMLFREALVIAQNTGNIYAENVLWLNLGNQKISEGKLSELQPIYERALALSMFMGNLENKVIAWRGLAIATLAQRNTNMALQFALQAKQLADSLGLLAERQKCMTTLSNVYFALQNISAAEAMARQGALLADSITSIRIRSDVAELEAIYELQQKEERLQQQQASLHQKNIMNYALGGVAFLLLASMYLLWRTWRQKQRLQQQEIATLQQEKQLAAAEAVMKGEEQERTRLAKDLHDGLGGMLSGIKFSLQHAKGNVLLNEEGQVAFEKSIVMLDQSIHEMRRVAHNMMPESLVKFGLSKALTDFCHDMQQSSQLQISCHLHHADGLPKGEAIGVYRIVQELVNNILKHAHATEALVQVTQHDGLLTITVEDNGRGMAISSDTGHAAGMGWNNIRSRVHFLKGHIDVQSSPTTGTSVHIEWPVQG